MHGPREANKGQCRSSTAVGSANDDGRVRRLRVELNEKSVYVRICVHELGERRTGELEPGQRDCRHERKPAAYLWQVSVYAAECRTREDIP